MYSIFTHSGVDRMQPHPLPRTPTLRLLQYADKPSVIQRQTPPSPRSQAVSRLKTLSVSVNNSVSLFTTSLLAGQNRVCRDPPSNRVPPRVTGLAAVIPGK